ncbi:MAG TPA: glycerol-3-phosphate dehydrogenase [Pyrinomonadaceae bacterium]|nr:glycerol-3-phosphate dehydrogenase [Pyrinomonadaceae bacterium]
MDTEFDLIVVGAGINGAGIARDAAMRGLKVLLVDKGDVGGGTSAGSTRLIHGGLRYLEHFEFGLVRESLRERETLLRIAPHLVRPLAITIPIYKESARGWAKIRAGMIAYELLAWGKSLPRYRMQSVEETLRRMPGLRADGLVGSAVYFDAQVEFAERLVVENVLAAIECGASVLTHTRVGKLLSEDGRVRGVQLEGDFGKPALAKVVINAAGPWVDQLIEQKGIGGASGRLIGGTKGSHVVVAQFAGAPEGAVYLEAVSDRRPFFVIPWNGNYLIGTTDVRFEDDPDEVRSELWEVDYLLAETNRAFPAAALTRESVLYTYSGVRPLPFTRNDDEQSITRKHFLREHPQVQNLISVVGGKLTTYRSLAEECVDLIFRKLERPSPLCETARVPLPGARETRSEFSLQAAPRGKLKLELRTNAADVCERWRRVYGSRAKELAELAQRLDDHDPLTAEIVFAFEKEFATTLADCFLRRTMIGLNADLGLGDIDRAAKIGKKFLGWTDERANREVEAYKAEISNRIGDGFHHRQ